ncbi:ATP-binding cassette domain-containing protein [Dactylosporangium sp. NPDC005555]|uniref:ATP-binding cassette domain-containing protein n=1 Tax=Dactylosporangium sp. NPDC005555 TaxID=3154889 RepID=UPI0033AFFE80
MRVLGRAPSGAVADVGFVAQDKPLYRNLTVGETVRMGAWLNPGWDRQAVVDRIERIGITPEQKVGGLSGGQRSQVALAVALGKRPRLLLLDEPVADLDPIARRDFLRTLMAEVAESGVTVVLSSHLLADVEKTCEFLVLLTTPVRRGAEDRRAPGADVHSHVQLADHTETLLAQHRLVTGPRAAAPALTAAHSVVQADYTDRQASLVLRARGPIDERVWTVRPISLEALALAYMSAPEQQETAA